MHKLQINEDVPAKPFAVIVNDETSESCVNVATTIGMLDEDYNNALRVAKIATRKDGFSRSVQIRQVLRHTLIERE